MSIKLAMSHQVEELSAEELDAVVGASGGYHYTPNPPPNPPPTSPLAPFLFSPGFPIPSVPVLFPGNTITFG